MKNQLTLFVLRWAKISLAHFFWSYPYVEILWIAQERSHRTCEKFTYPVVKITSFSDYQTWPTLFWEIHEVRKGLWAFYLDCAFRMLIDWAGNKDGRSCSVYLLGRLTFVNKFHSYTVRFWVDLQLSQCDRLWNSSEELENTKGKKTPTITTWILELKTWKPGN